MDGSLHSELRKLDLLPISNRKTTEDAIRSWIQKRGSVVRETGLEGSIHEAGAHGQNQRQWVWTSRGRRRGSLGGEVRGTPLGQAGQPVEVGQMDGSRG